MLRRLAPTNKTSGHLLSSSSSSSSFFTSAATTSFARRFKANKKTSALDVAYLIEDGATISVGGFVATGAPEAVLEAIGQRYKETGHPKNCTLIFEGGPGDYKTRGINHLAQEGLIKRSFGSHYGQVPMLGQLALANKIEAYNLPMGSISRMIRAAASKGPGHITQIGFGTLCDPVHGGGKLNSITPDFIQQIEINNQKYLMFPTIPIDVAIVRGTTGDTEGNISMEKEALLADNFVIAQAACTNRGISIAQVERLAAPGSIGMKHCYIPGAMIDAVVVAPPEKHWMSYFCEYNPAASGEIKKNIDYNKEKQILDLRKVVARRAAMELAPDFKVNLGIGMPDGVAAVASEEMISSYVSFTTEAGAYGGFGLGGHQFGPAENADCLIPLCSQFDAYNGGINDSCFLGLGEVDISGNVNVTRLGNSLTGPGGFIDISQATSRVNLLGSFAAGAKVEIKDGKVNILKEGHTKKFVKSVREITFSGSQAIRLKQKVKYMTERCVFDLGSDETGEPQLILREIAPGISIEKDILPMMDFLPIIPEDVGVMPDYIFHEKPMGLLEKAFSPDFTHRTSYAAESNTFYMDLSNLSINSEEMSEKLFERLHHCAELIAESKPADAEKKMNFVVNYNRFKIDDNVAESYFQKVNGLNSKWALSNRRFSSRAFRRHQLANDWKITENFTAADLTKLLNQLGKMSPVKAAALKNYKDDDQVPSALSESLLQ